MPVYPKRIELKAQRSRYREAAAAGVINPGHLLKYNSDGAVVVHSTYGGSARVLFALEDALRGKTINDAYASGDQIPHQEAARGDEFYVRVPAGAVAIVIGDKLISNGDGTLVKALSESETLYVNAADSTAISNVATITAFDLSYTIPANMLRVGDIIRVKAQAIATATNSTDTLVITLKIGSTTVIATAAVDVANNDIGTIDAEFVIRTIGASGTFIASGEQSLGVPGTVTSKPFILGSTAIDTTATQAITVSATWSVASASNSVTLRLLEVSMERAASGELEIVAYANEAKDNSAGVTETFVKVVAA